MKLADGSIRIEPLDQALNRTAFACGNDSLDRYLREQASQDTRRGIARVFVAVEPSHPTHIVGFFTLSAASVIAPELPPQVAKRLPLYPIPAALIGRLAVDHGFARRGLARSFSPTP